MPALLAQVSLAAAPDTGTSVGPLRLVVTTDKRQTRSLYQIVSLRLAEIPAR